MVVILMGTGLFLLLMIVVMAFLQKREERDGERKNEGERRVGFHDEVGRCVAECIYVSVGEVICPIVVEVICGILTNG